MEGVARCRLVASCPLRRALCCAVSARICFNSSSPLCSAVYCNPEIMYLTDIHEPTLRNLEYNAKRNHLQGVTPEDIAELKTDTTTTSSSVFNIDPSHNSLKGSKNHAVEVLNLNWKDPSTYPAQQVCPFFPICLIHCYCKLPFLFALAHSVAPHVGGGNHWGRLGVRCGYLTNACASHRIHSC